MTEYKASVIKDKKNRLYVRIKKSILSGYRIYECDSVECVEYGHNYEINTYRNNHFCGSVVVRKIEGITVGQTINKKEVKA